MISNEELAITIYEAGFRKVHHQTARMEGKTTLDVVAEGFKK